MSCTRAPAPYAPRGGRRVRTGSLRLELSWDAPIGGCRAGYCKGPRCQRGPRSSTQNALRDASRLGMIPQLTIDYHDTIGEWGRVRWRARILDDYQRFS